MSKPSVNNRKRLLIQLAVFSGGLLGLIVFRVGYWQLVRSEWLQMKAADQWTREVTVEAERGDILDRNGNLLASSASCDAVVLRPSQITDANHVADALSEILEMDRAVVYERAVSKYSERWLKRQITSEQAQRIRELDLDGVVLVEDKKRYYPLGNFLTQVLGFTSVDGKGLEGIESRFDKYLSGTPGLIAIESDVVGRELPFGADEYVAPVDGNDVILTIDMTIQSFAEKYAEQCLLEQNAKRVMAIAMDPDTGDVLAMTVKPDYDNNNPPRNDIKILQELTRNAAISDAYEPGSTFKIATLAAAIDSGAVTTDSHFTCVGYRLVDGDKIKCWRFDRPHGTQTLTEAAQNSCNPAFMDMALGMGVQTFYDYLYRFGFGSQSGIELYGEGTGIVTPIKYVRNVDLARIGFGQAIAITPLQLVSAACTAVNGGMRMQPHIVKEIRDNEGNTVVRYEPEPLGQVISPETSALMRQILRDVVEHGSGRNAMIEGYTVGGKTGTAQKYDENGRIMHDVHISSFLGFAPAEDPRVVVLLVVDEPNAAVDYGSIVAAPYVKSILEESLLYLNVPRQSGSGETETREVPDVRTMEVEQAEAALSSAGFKALVEGYGGKVVEQMPPPGTLAPKNSVVMVCLEDEDPRSSEDYFVTVPDLMGLTAIKANEKLEAEGLQAEFSGPGGVVTGQTPAAGDSVPEGSVVMVEISYPEQTDD
ncbi:MAG: penicillin-binding transpeptidase domain-containing protein [Christensenellales bacterium]